MNYKSLGIPTGLFTATLVLLTLSAPVRGADAPSRHEPPLFAAPQADPIPMYSVTWTATGHSAADTTDVNGRRTVRSRKVAMTGSTIVRQLDSGAQDNFPLDTTTTDSEDILETAPCNPGTEYDHTVISIADPYRYTGGPGHEILVLAPMQHEDGSWYMLDPFVGFYVNRLFNYRFAYDFTRCWGESGTGAPTMPYGVYIDLGQPGELQGDAQGKVFQKTIAFIAPFSDPPFSVQWNVTVRKLEGRDLTVKRIEVTQGLQNEANSILLVRGRRTVVRAYIDVGSDQIPIANVTGRLTAYRGTTTLGSVTPFNPGGRITAPVWPDWKQIDHTLNFELPFAWTMEPSLRLEVEVNHDHSVSEINFYNNKLEAPFQALACDGTGITYAPIHYIPPGGASPADPSGNIVKGQEFLRKIYPVPDKQFFYFPRRELTLTHDINAPGAADLVLAGLNRELLSSSAPRAGHIYGWLPPLAFNGNGWGAQPGQAAFGNDTESPNRWRRTLAHEIGHNYDLGHGGLTTAGNHWFDIYDRVIKPVPPSVGGPDLLDVMQPDRLEQEAWISQENYEFLITQMCSFNPGAVPSRNKALAVSDSLLVTGIVSNTTANGTLDPIFRFSTIPTYTLPAGSQYCVKMKDAANAVLSQYCFNERFADDSSAPGSTASFGMVVPYPIGLSRVELYTSTLLLDSQVASAHPPTVTVTFPNASGLTLGGNQTVAWTGADPDGEVLTYNILYSRDNGVTWMGVGSGIVGSSYELNFSGLAGTTGASGRIKVMVSDGFYTAEDISDNPFTVANKPPSAAIISPPSGATFTTGLMVVLQGVGLDLENGSLGDSASSWTSNKDGALGTGQLLETILSTGVHTITLTATDSDGLSASASIQLTVVAPSWSPNQHFLPLIIR
jgi:hypothetical protein